MWYDTAVTRTFGIRYPILQAPMAGGPATPELVAAVSDEGGLGFLGAGYMSPDAIRADIRRIRELTDRPFGVNLFIPDENIRLDVESVAAMIEHLKSLDGLPDEVRRELDGIRVESALNDSFAKQLEVVMEERVPVFSFTFGCPSPEQIRRLQGLGIRVIGTATTVAEARYLQEAGVDAVVAQGYEAGGHRGTFLGAHSSSLIGTIALVPQIVDQLHIPVIASGGIMDGRGIAACLALGASAVQMGTAFLASRESGAHPAYKNALLHSGDAQTTVTDTFSGKPARGLRNSFIAWMERYDGPIPPYPVQNALTRPIRNWAARQGNPEFMSLWAGQGSAKSRDASARDIVRQLVQEVERAIGQATG